MCYRTATPDLDMLQGYFQREALYAREIFTIEDFEHFFCADGFLMPRLPISTTENPRLIEPAMWKLIPHWVRTEADAKNYANTLNAASEEIFEKASYKPYIGKYRALLWIDGFFEPHHPDAKTTIPYFIHHKDAEPLTLGCVYSNWLNHETGEVIKTFSIITTPANELLSKVHNEKKRMPLVIPPDKRDEWLSNLGKSQIQSLMTPLPDGILEAYPVSRTLYRKGFNPNVPEAVIKAGDALI